jgi:hypothetical protein
MAQLVGFTFCWFQDSVMRIIEAASSLMKMMMMMIHTRAPH